MTSILTIYNSHGQPVYKKGNRYIIPDIDSHNGGVWKIFDNKGKRLGTADANLRIFKK
ncbi:toxin C-terminal domain-containing protein [Moraxella nonliquefaciens]|uniref:toxin C-terminal domain-containing protein n=1 Tax=Moraxella nonliquefaciens TaxID=478 RepID=UPI0012E920CA